MIALLGCKRRVSALLAFMSGVGGDAAWPRGPYGPPAAAAGTRRGGVVIVPGGSRLSILLSAS